MSDTLSKVQIDADCPNWKVFALLDYMERVAPHIERDDPLLAEYISKHGV